MVRLKVVTEKLSRAARKFQFLYGANKSQSPYWEVSLIFYFNSSMVRLKDVETVASDTTIFHFNSSIVRLKDGETAAELLARKKFQFLYGAIKSNLTATLLKEYGIFQFLYGAIKSRSFAPDGWRRYISIPLWCD